MTDTYECPWHESRVPQGRQCGACVERYATLPAPEMMTVDERIAELSDWFDRKILTIDMDKLHQRIEALVGRPVWTHELVDREAFIREMRSGQSASFGDVLDKIPPHLKTIVVSLDDEEHGSDSAQQQLERGPR